MLAICVILSTGESMTKSDKYNDIPLRMVSKESVSARSSYLTHTSVHFLF